MGSTTLPTVFVKRRPVIDVGDCHGCAKKEQKPKADLRVTLITPTLGLGGAEQWIRTLICNSDPQRIAWTVAVLCPNDWHPIIAEPVARHADVRTIGPQLRNRDELLHSALRQADAVIAWGGGDYWPLPTKTPVIFVAHGVCNATRRAVADAVVGGATQIVAVSHASAAVIKDVCGKRPLEVIWNGADTSRLKDTMERDAVRHGLWKVPQDRFAHDLVYVGYCGRLSPEKNVESILTAVSLLPERYRCVLIGDTGPGRDRLLETGRQRLGDRLIVVTAVDDVGNHLSALDCLVQVSPREANSLSLIEGMLLGVPIVTTRVGAVDEFEQAAGEPLFWSVPEEPLADEIAGVIRTAVREGSESPRVVAAEKLASRELMAGEMVQRWDKLLSESAQTSSEFGNRDFGSHDAHFSVGRV